MLISSGKASEMRGNVIFYDANTFLKFLNSVQVHHIPKNFKNVKPKSKCANKVQKLTKCNFFTTKIPQIFSINLVQIRS